MADHSSNQRADSAVFSEDDPFAELTRIMGHDPRRAEVSGSETEQEGDDLALELENELLGDLAEFSDEVHEEMGAQNDWEPRQSSDWRFDVQPAAGKAVPAHDEPSVDMAADMADELDESFASSFESEMRLEPAEEVSSVSDPQQVDHRSSGPEQGLEDDDFGQHFSEFELDASEPSASAGVVEQPRDEPIEEPADSSDLEFGEQDFAQLDNDLEASLAVEDWFSPDDAGEDKVDESANPEAFHAHQFDHLEADGAEAESAAGDEPAVFDAIETAGQPDMPMDVGSAPENAVSADPFLSPQAFASSIAQGAERASAVDGDVAREEHDFTASLEEQLSAQAFGEQEVVKPTLQPRTDESEPVDSAWAVSEVADRETHEPSSEDPVDASLSAPFWLQPEERSATGVSSGEPSVPHIDTVDVPGNERVQVEDAAHIPEFLSEPERAPEAEADDLERALARAFGDSESLPDTGPADGDEEPRPAMLDDAYAAAALQPGEPAREDDDFGFETAFADSFPEPDRFAEQDEAGAVDKRNADAADAFVVSDMASWDDPSEGFEGGADAAAPAMAVSPAARPGLFRNRRNLAMAGAFGGIAVLALVGLFAFGGGSEDNSAPVVVRADDEPIKVKPDNPGGQQVPNQDNQVYQRVSGAEAGDNPVQERLVSTAEEPVDVPQAAPKSEERLVPGADDSVTPTSEPVTAMTPRRVRTMVVRPDGTIVPREPEAQAQDAEVAAGTGSDALPVQESPAANAQPQANLEITPDARLAATDQAGSATADTDGPAANVPDTAPVPTSRPAAPPTQSQQPAAERTQPAQVAAAPSQPAQPVAQAPAPVTSGTDGWSVQISSQPTVEAAQKSYQDMARRYGGLLTGKGVNIVKADIAGKGTYYRVRIPSASKDDAIRLCSQLKSAGGSCFVSK
ncbi:SPOR domain-containing protein [Nitratireductor rhodophyticola]|uniref:SPOR domain-containing protein n=1 Tax=Nitratireductor rhodophyticola TaxID=2854036 RepID=UPI00300A6F0D